MPPPDGRRTPTILAMGGGGFTAGSADPALDELVLRLTRQAAPARLPPPHRGRRLRAPDPPLLRDLPGPAVRAESHLTVQARPSSRFHSETHLLSQDAIYVGGGSMVNLLAIWKAQGLDAILREAWQAGVVLAGLSAGSMCWFEYGVSTSHGPRGPGARARLPARLQLRPPRQRALPPPGLPRGRAQRRDPARLRGRRRRRADLPRADARRGGQRAPRRACLRGGRGRRACARPLARAHGRAASDRRRGAAPAAAGALAD